MMKAIWKGTTIAESNNTVIVEGNHYFPPDTVKMEYMMPSETKTGCPWKGIANYYTINVGGELNNDAAWYYAEPKEAAKNIKGYVAFWRGVKVID
ncbi:MAG: DUF427 domain-containing protein [Gammaproteobacteria bacterium]|nr:DUF427 domain-containing protein [Gammaproteobacteria bacterium]